LAGEITEIGVGEFTVTIEGNSQIVVEVSEDTSYLGALESFSDLEVGMDVAVAGHRSGEGTMVARVVATRDDLPFGTRIGGEVTAVGTDSISIETPRGEAFTFGVTADTDFLSRQNMVASLGDIEVGDHVMVLYEQADEGTLTSNVILVGGPPPETESN
jgi:hypothetical protein